MAVAEAKLPEEVKRIGVTTKKKSPSILLCVNLISTRRRAYDQLLSEQLRDDSTSRTIWPVSRASATWPSSAPAITACGSGSTRDKLASLQMTASDVIKAIREQNVQVAAGRLGQPPVPPAPWCLSNCPSIRRAGWPAKTNSRRSLSRRVPRVKSCISGTSSAKSKYAPDGITIVERGVELGAKNYDVNSYLDGEPAVTLAVFQLPGSNALETAEAIRAKMEELKKKFPEGVEYRIVYDTTVFVEESMTSVYHTLIEAFILVFIVVLVFLQNWRATIIPMVAVPVSLIGTFARDGGAGVLAEQPVAVRLVLAIGIVVDDAIVVVENVERLMAAEGLSPREASRKAMDEVTGPVIAIALVLCAVFVPTAFMAGISGQFYRQFALTIAASTIISAFNSLTLSPALCALMLKPHATRRPRSCARSAAAGGDRGHRRSGRLCAAVGSHRTRCWVSRSAGTVRGSVRRANAGGAVGIAGRCVCRAAPSAGGSLGGIVNRCWAASSRASMGLRLSRSTAMARPSAAAAAQRDRAAGLRRLDGADLPRFPGRAAGFHPGAGQGLSGPQCPVARRRRASTGPTSGPGTEQDRPADTEGVAHTIDLPGYSTILGTNISNVGGMFVILEPFEERAGKPEAQCAGSHGRAAPEVQYVTSKRAIGVFGAPPVEGLGTTGGFKLQVQDRRGAGLRALQGAVQDLAEQGNRQPRTGWACSPRFSVTQPQLFVEIDREKAKAQGVSLDEVNTTLQAYLGSFYVNDFTFQNRNWQVNVQADPTVPDADRGHRPPGSPQRQGQPRAVGDADQGARRQRPGDRQPLQPLSLRRNQRQHGARRQFRPGDRPSWTAWPSSSCPPRWASNGRN